MNIFDWRNRDADVQIDLQFRVDEDDPDENTIWVEVSDGRCNNARWNDAGQEKEPSRHVEIVLFMFAFRITITVCTILRAARDTETKDRRASYRAHL